MEVIIIKGEVLFINTVYIIIREWVFFVIKRKESLFRMKFVGRLKYLVGGWVEESNILSCSIHMGNTNIVWKTETQQQFVY